MPLAMKSVSTLDGLCRSVWVIQRTCKGQGIGYHMDDDDYRRLAFCYYLTPDQWSSKEGGVLQCYEPESKLLIMQFTPVFNSMVIWTMDDKKMGPLHRVTSVRAEEPMARIALVGFYININQ